jgi:hypothetical protein
LLLERPCVDRIFYFCLLFSRTMHQRCNFIAFVRTHTPIQSLILYPHIYHAPSPLSPARPFAGASAAIDGTRLSRARRTARHSRFDNGWRSGHQSETTLCLLCHLTLFAIFVIIFIFVIRQFSAATCGVGDGFAAADIIVIAATGQDKSGSVTSAPRQ